MNNKKERLKRYESNLLKYEFSHRLVRIWFFVLFVVCIPAVTSWENFIFNIELEKIIPLIFLSFSIYSHLRIKHIESIKMYREEKQNK